MFAKSALVCQILADVTGRSVERSTFTELGVRGVAALALVATGHAEDLRAALGSFGDTTRRFDPNIEVRALHDSQAAVFTAVRDAIRSQWAPMRDLRMASYDGYRARAHSDNTVVLARPSLPDHRAEPTRTEHT